MISGFSGTAVGLGGPPLAVLYREQPPAESRPTLAVIFSLGIAMSLVALAVSGSLDVEQASAGSWIAIAILGGVFLARPLIRRLSDATIRTGLLVWAAAGSITALARVVLA